MTYNIAVMPYSSVNSKPWMRLRLYKRPASLAPSARIL